MATPMHVKWKDEEGTTAAKPVAGKRTFPKKQSNNKFRDKMPKKPKKKEPQNIPDLQVPEVSSTTSEHRNLSSAGKKKQKKNRNKAKSAPTNVHVAHDGSGPKFLDETPKRSFLLVKHPGTETKWFEYQNNEVDSSGSSALSDSVVRKFRQYSSQLLESDVQLFSKLREKRKPGESAWMRTVSAGGTMADKVAALTLLVQESPVHSLEYLDSLLAKVKKKSRREATMALDTLKELFVQEMLPPDRKLTPFESRPLEEAESGNKETRDKKLLLWFFEDQLKHKYQELVVAVEALCHDSVDATRLTAIRTMADLLCSRSEQEQYLLSAIVNKLGDNSYKVSSKVVTSLSKVAHAHPNMKTIIVREVERLIYRPNVTQKAQFYGICFLSQVMLQAAEKALAVQLLDIYFNLFKILIKKGQIDNRMLAVLLAGTNRAFPYAKGNTEQLLGEMDTLYKVVGVAQFGTSLQTLLLLYQVLDASEGVSDRYYCALYRKLFDPHLHSSSAHHASLFFNLLYKTLRGDAVERRVQAFVKRLLQLALEGEPAFACGVLLLISELQKDKTKTMKVDVPILRLQKNTRLAQFASGAEEEEDEEHFVDAPDTEDVKPDVKPDAERKSATWVHKQNLPGSKTRSDYDPWHRNPLFAAADITWDFELCLLAKHFHPSVATFANTLLQSKSIDYGGDPLQDFSLMRFLDRFVYRNPKSDKVSKKEKEGEGGEEGSGRGRQKIVNRRRSYNPWGVKAMAVTSDEYALKQEKDIPVDERFLHRFITTVGLPSRKKKGDADEDDAGSVASEDFDRLLDKFEPGGANEEFDVDFAGQFSAASTSKHKKQKRKKGKKSDSESDDDDNDPDMDLDDDDLSLDEKEEADSEMDLSDTEYNAKRKKRRKDENVFESAEKFAELLEDAGEAGEMRGNKKKKKGMQYMRHRRSQGPRKQGGKRKK